jgi:hypothetical protein
MGEPTADPSFLSVCLTKSIGKKQQAAACRNSNSRRKEEEGGERG